MVENRPWLTFAAHAVLALGLLIVAFPVYMTFVASTHDQTTMLSGPTPLIPGPHLV
jgi:sn-glycerol 3-phosphate transport system permease protein